MRVHALRQTTPTLTRHKYIIDTVYIRKGSSCGVGKTCRSVTHKQLDVVMATQAPGATFIGWTRSTKSTSHHAKPINKQSVVETQEGAAAVGELFRQDPPSAC